LLEHRADPVLTQPATRRRWPEETALRAQEQARLIALLPRMEEMINQLTAAQRAEANEGRQDHRPNIAQTNPKPRPSGCEQGL
jgi:hypothetical protein